MINLPPINTTPFKATAAAKKSQRRAYAVEPEREEQKPVTAERRGHRNRRKTPGGQYVVDRRVSSDRRKGRVNLIV
ncbi:hypothetical protein NO559_03590 [Dasania sp. GY-MA-18]|uniref:Uncharacterized protein n=1 Tax=Dasania phycosphaerae TaxID=2950436 RepID=A0A9J6RIK9_9GAMM|nr:MULTISPECIES: hypothetical protein [Dasania]MCR8921840.1 hypothetical protein [Dasania sp. GY-MA-18]MCZ0864268.1 hypothetical protein [Dasania phycosphaerae]MCZ0867996.1 hypothetical protein [Dasania phycosphaerae]